MRFSFGGAPPSRPVGALLHDLDKRKEWLGKARVDYQLVGCWLDIFGYELPPEEGADWCRFMNETMLKDIKPLPALTPLACVPLQSGKLAAQVLEEALGQGFHGAMIGTQPKGELGKLDDPDLNPFWEACTAHKATLMVHPMFVCGDDRVKDYDLMNAVGRVSDTSIALARLMFAGHLTRYPGMNLADLAWRRGAAFRARPLQAQQHDPQRRIRRCRGRVQTALFRHACCSSRGRCATSATSRAPTRSASAPTSRSRSAIPIR